MAHYGPLFGRCCSYPQGALSIFPTLLTTAAVFLSFYALSEFRGDKEEGVTYMCIEYDTMNKPKPYVPTLADLNRTAALNQTSSFGDLTGTNTTPTSASGYTCYSLQLTSPDYWTGTYGAGETDTWPIQVGALFGILTATFGGMILFLLITATCFALKARQLRRMMRTLFACCILSLSTMIALYINPCSSNENKSVTECTRGKTHLEEGAVMHVLAAIFYGWASYSMMAYTDIATKTEGLPHYIETTDELTTLRAANHNASSLSSSPTTPPRSPSLSQSCTRANEASFLPAIREDSLTEVDEDTASI